MAEILKQKLHPKLEGSGAKFNYLRALRLLGLLGGSSVLAVACLANQDAKTPGASLDSLARVAMAARGGTSAAALWATVEAAPTATPWPRQVREGQNRDRTSVPATPSLTPTAAPTLTPTETPTVQEVTPETQRVLNGVTVYLDSDGLPSAFLDPETWTRVELSETEKDQLRQDQATALTRALPQLSITLPVLEGNTRLLHPERYEVGTDVVEADTLEQQYGITIYNSPQVELFFREQAFEAGGLLELQQAYFEASGVELWIVLIDDYVVRSNNLGSDVPQDLRDLIDLESFDVDTYRQRYITALERYVNDFESNFAGSEAQMVDLMTYTRMLEFFRTASDFQLLSELQIGARAYIAGRHYRPQRFIRDQRVVYASVIFLAAGDTPDSTQGLGSYRFFFGPDGEVRVSDPHQMTELGPDFAPDPNFSYPQVDDLVRRATNDADGYLIGAQNHQLGLTTVHELNHHLLINVWPRIYGWFLDSSEESADRETIEYLSQAELWLAASNDRGYQLALRGPKGVQRSKRQ